jgi:ketosteroid isomerase-like protein
MPIDLPQAITAYFTADANKGDTEAIAQCFTENAVVTDENHAHQGRAAIRQWKANASTKYQYTSEPFTSEEVNGKTVVTSRVAGNFPGSPVNLRYFFKIEGDKITSLEITL